MATVPVHFFTEASFFSNGREVYIETWSPREPLLVQQMLMQLPDGSRQQWSYSRTTGGSNRAYQALTDRTLLGTESSASPFRYDSLSLTELPGWKEDVRIPFGIGHDSNIAGHEPVISDDRKTLVVASGRNLIYRRTEDLALQWDRQVENRYLGVVRMAITKNGNRVAAAVIDQTGWQKQREFYVGVYAGGDGSTLAKLAVNGEQGVAVSNDGRLLATGKREIIGREIRLRVESYDIASVTWYLTLTTPELGPIISRFWTASSRVIGLYISLPMEAI